MKPERGFTRSQALMDAGLSWFFCSSPTFLVQTASGQRKKQGGQSVPLQRVRSNYHAEAQQTYPQVWNIILNRRPSKKPTKTSLRWRQNVLICRKDSWKGTERGQRVKLCPASIHYWSFMIQQTGAASHRDDLSVACSHLCPDVHSAGLLKEKNHSVAWKDCKSGGKKEVVCWNVSI